MPPWLRMTLFLVVLCVSLAGLATYVHRRAVRTLGLRKVGRRVLGGVLLASGLSVVAGRLLRGVAADAVLEAAMIAGMTVMLAVIIAGILMFPVELVRAAPVLWQWARKRPVEPPAPARTEDPGAPSPALSGAPPLLAAASPSLGRRELVTRAAWGSALVLGTGHSIYGALIGRYDYQIEERPIPLPGLPRALDGYTIVQLSDVHFGTFVGDRELRIAEELVRQARPDLIVLTGDLVDHEPSHADQVARLVRRIAPLARDGVAAIPGNHDYYAGIDLVLERLRAGGAQVMRNHGRVIQDGFALVGIDDVWAERNGYQGGPDLDRAIAMVPPDLPRVLLCHNPVFFPEASDKVQLQLSGHTHGGQVNVLFDLGAMVLPYGYSQGLYTRDGAWLYVNRGFGVAGPPARVNSPPEVTRIILTYG